MKLYDLLVLTFSENGKLADLDALRAKSGVSAEEWDDLLQYTSQVRRPYPSLLSLYARNTLGRNVDGS